MELTHELRLNAESFFDALAQSAACDISQAEGKIITPEQIHPGYCYSKIMKNKLGQKGTVEVTIKDFAPVSRYSASFRSGQGITTIYYDIEQKENGGIQIHYKETYDNESKLQMLNYKLAACLYNSRAKKRIRNTLDAIERYVKESAKTQ